MMKGVKGELEEDFWICTEFRDLTIKNEKIVEMECVELKEEMK
jgi:hypothetical protein